MSRPSRAAFTIPREVLGVPGHAAPVEIHAGGRIVNQVWRSELRPAGEGYRARVFLRFDRVGDNSAPSFGVTCDTYNAAGILDGCGADHATVAAYFPELAPLLTFHLFDTAGPMHYPANALYLAGDRDAWGRAPGQASRYVEGVRFGGVPVTHVLGREFWQWLQGPAAWPAGTPAPYAFTLRRIGETKDGRTYEGWTFEGFPGATSWHTCPFKTERAAREFLGALQGFPVTFERWPVEWSEGKPRELDAARSCAAWPDATDADLMQPREALAEVLAARLPALVAAFLHAMADSCGFTMEKDPQQ